MKKLILIIGIVLMVLVGFGQVTNTRVVRIANNSTAWGENLPKGTYIYDLTLKNLWILDAASASTQTIATETNKTQINASGTDSQNLTWDAVNGHIEISGGNDADVGGFGTANENYGFVKGSNGSTTSFLRGDNTWQTVLTALPASALEWSDTTAALGVGIATYDDLRNKVADETYSEANFNGHTTIGVSQDDFYDFNHIGDTDDDGLVNKVDLSSAGFVKTDASGVLSVDATAYSSLIRITQWVEVAADDLTQPYPVTLGNTPNATSKITVQINGVPLKYAAGTTNGTFNFTGTALSIYANVYQYDQIEIDYEY